MSGSYEVPNMPSYGRGNINMQPYMSIMQGHEDNPYDLSNYSTEAIYWIKASLKWEEGNWKSQEFLILRKKLMYCLVRKEAHWDFAYKYNILAKYLDIPKIILSSILSTSLFVNASDTESFSTTMQYVNASLGTSLAVIVGLDSYVKFSELFTYHRSSSLDYGKLAGEIERILQSPIDERKSFSTVIAEIDEKYSKLRDESPFISQKKIAYYIKLFNENTQFNDRVNTRSKTKLNTEQEQDDEEFTKAEKEDEDKEKIKIKKTEQQQNLINQNLINQNLINQNLINQNLIEQNLVEQNLINEKLSDQNKTTNEGNVNNTRVETKECDDDRHVINFIDKETN